MSVLVTGGAGYIGSHMVLALRDAGEDVVVLDNLSTGFRWTVPEDVKFVAGDAGDHDLVLRLILANPIDAVIHFAGSIVVPESVADPLGYYLNNTCKSRTLIASAVAAKVPHFIFSSSAAVYGMPEENPVDGGGGGEHEVFHAVGDRSGDQLARFHRVVEVIAERVGDRIRHHHRAGEVHHRLDAAAAQEPVEQHAIADVADDELGLRRHRPVEAAGQVVENDYLLAAADEFPHHVAADIAGAAGHEYAHTLSPASRSLDGPLSVKVRHWKASANRKVEVW